MIQDIVASIRTPEGKLGTIVISVECDAAADEHRQELADGISELLEEYFCSPLIGTLEHSMQTNPHFEDQKELAEPSVN
jgi:hypothetical protein